MAGEVEGVTRTRCSDCGKLTDEAAPLAPMLCNASWAKLAEKDETLCAKCMFARAGARGVMLALADLSQCPFNMWHQPHSWFDLFAPGAPPEVITAWLNEIEEAERRIVDWRDHGTSEGRPPLRRGTNAREGPQRGAYGWRLLRRVGGG